MNRFKMRAGTFLLEVQDDGGVDRGHGEVVEGSVLQLHVQRHRAQVRLPAQRPHGLKHTTQTAVNAPLYQRP